MTRLEQLWESGELYKAAQGASSWNEVARRLGWTEKALKCQRLRIRAAGRPEPVLAELQGVREVEGEFAEEEPTQPGIQSKPDKWASANALLGEWGDPPFPVIPKNFGVRSLSSQVDSKGNIEKQWVDSRRNSESYADIQPAIPPGHGLRGISTLVDETGNVRAQWIKTSAQNDQRQDWLDAIRAESAPLPPLEHMRRSPMLDDDLLTTYPVGDPHIGLLAWHEDAGENFDMDIAERNLVAAFNHLVAIAPPSRDALLIYIGDNAHADSQSNQTTKGTRVDADGRTVKMARRIIRTIRRNIETVLTKHERARVIVERGNHDELISAMIALGLALLYENEPRVSVDQSPEMYHWVRFGSVLIGTHHGDKAKPMDLLGVMAVDRQQDWGETKHRRFYCGHLHHQITKEVPGIVLHYLPTLASSDAWHRAMGYRSQRAMYMDVFHKEHGHVNRHFVGVDQLRAA